MIPTGTSIRPVLPTNIKDIKLQFRFSKDLVVASHSRKGAEVCISRRFNNHLQIFNTQPKQKNNNKKPYW